MGDYTPLSQLPDLLLPWFLANKRDLPWRRDREPYHVWLSEIMLQQTRVEAARGYYLRFLARFPTIAALAEAEEAELFKLWEGLGYYSRARNLQKAARVIMDRYGGQFPKAYGEIRALPGIGDYTAGALCSICYDQKTPAVDGNVLRVVSRLCDHHGCTDDAAVKREFSAALAEIYPDAAGDFTQALMELGALVCLPGGRPQCALCPTAGACLALRRGTASLLPVRREKKARRQENMTVFLLTCGDKAALRKRPDTGLLAGLYEFPNISKFLSQQEILQIALDWNLEPQYLEKLVSRTHIFTHIQWNMTGVRLHCGAEGGGFLWVDRRELTEHYALPTAFRQFLGDF